MIQLQVPLLGLPISLILLETGQVALVKLAPTFATIFDNDNEIVISSENVIVKEKKLEYNTVLNLTEDLKNWLVSLNLEQPWE